jgi:hypothetical protein
VASQCAKLEATNGRLHEHLAEEKSKFESALDDEKVRHAQAEGKHEKKKQALQAKLAAKKDELELKTTELAKTTRSLEATNSSLAEATAGLQLAVSARDSLQQQLGELSQTHALSATALAEAQSLLVTLQAQLSLAASTHASSSAALQSQTDELRAELKSVQSLLESVIAERVGLEKELKEREGQARRRDQELEQELEKSANLAAILKEAQRNAFERDQESKSIFEMFNQEQQFQADLKLALDTKTQLMADLKREKEHLLQSLSAAESEKLLQAQLDSRRCYCVRNRNMLSGSPPAPISGRIYLKINVPIIISRVLYHTSRIISPDCYRNLSQLLPIVSSTIYMLCIVCLCVCRISDARRRGGRRPSITRRRHSLDGRGVAAARGGNGVRLLDHTGYCQSNWLIILLKSAVQSLAS